MMIFFALMIAAGVIFGTGAVVVDLGYGMSQQTVMQNAADSGALSAAKFLSTSVGSVDPVTGLATYVATDSQVYNAASQFAGYNRMTNNPSDTYKLAVEYLIWNSSTQTCAAPASPVFTSSSDAGLVASHNGTINTAPSNQLGGVPIGTCGVRAFTTVTYNGIFGGVPPLNATRQTAGASAAAQILPAGQPTTTSDTWPITNWEGDPADPACMTFTPGAPPCVFWNSNPNWTNGNFKLLTDMSRYSDLVYPTILRAQHILDYDHNYPGNSNQPQTDLSNWLTYGWHGKLDASDSRCSNLDPTNQASWTTNCTNSRLEVYGGTLGANIGSVITAYIAANAEGTDTSSQNLGQYVTKQVFLWKYGEYNIDPTTDIAGSLWTTDKGKTGSSGSSIQRVIVDQIRCFRFYYNSITNNSQVPGYYVSCPASQSSGNGPPSAYANVVKLVA